VNKKILVLPSWYPSTTEPHYAPFIQAQAQVLVRRFDPCVLYPEAVTWRHMLANRIPPPRRILKQNGMTEVFERAVIWQPKSPLYFYAKVLRTARRGFVELLNTWGKPDLIHAHVVLPAGWIACQIGREFGIPVVLTEHTGPFQLHLQTAYQRRLVHETLGWVEGIIAVSPALRRQILAFQPDLKIDVIGNVIQTNYFTPDGASQREPKSRIRFLAVAALVREKGVLDLLQAAHILLQRKFTDFEVVIGGDGTDRRRLESTANDLGLSKCCRFLGALTREGVRASMQSCSVFVLPSHGETFGVVLGEAMACGKPVIATRCGGPEYIVTPENGLLVEPGQPEALADAMQRFLTNQIHLDPIQIRRRVVERFGDQAFLDQIGPFYEHCLAQMKEKASIP